MTSPREREEMHHHNKDLSAYFPHFPPPQFLLRSFKFILAASILRKLLSFRDGCVCLKGNCRGVLRAKGYLPVCLFEEWRWGGEGGSHGVIAGCWMLEVWQLTCVEIQGEGQKKSRITRMQRS